MIPSKKSGEKRPQIDKSSDERKNPRKGSENHQKEKTGRTHPSLEEPRRIIYAYKRGSYKV
jgi:hypothetical protein